MRDLSNHEKNEGAKLNKQVEKLNNDMNNLQKDKESLEQEVAQLQEKMIDLQEQVRDQRWDGKKPPDKTRTKREFLLPVSVCPTPGVHENIDDDALCCFLFKSKIS